MTTYTITDCSNDTQLLDFISKASDGDIITFACSGTIPLASTLHLKSKGLTMESLTLDGSGQSVTLDGGNSVRVLLVDGIQLTLKGLTIANGNAQEESGGGMFIKKGGEATISQCTFTGNSASHGGGLLNEGKATVSNCTFSGNSAHAWGGGLYNNFAEMMVSNCTITANTANISGGIGGIGPLNISGTIVANNTARFSRPNGIGQIGSQGFNLLGDATDKFTITPTDQQSVDPTFDPAGLQSNGGPTQTIALQPGSPLIGTIPANQCPATDQRGYLPPPGFLTGDVGAYQSAYIAPTP